MLGNGFFVQNVAFCPNIPIWNEWETDFLGGERPKIFFLYILKSSIVLKKG
jgi:hypothetical protein